jgi:hypothetical protein
MRMALILKLLEGRRHEHATRFRTASSSTTSPPARHAALRPAGPRRARLRRRAHQERPLEQEREEGLIKIDADVPIDLNLVGYLAPEAKINIIRDGVLVEKKAVKLPETLTNVIRCENPRCISAVEQELDQVFKLTDRATATYRCIYCETKAH